MFICVSGGFDDCGRKRYKIVDFEGVLLSSVIEWGGLTDKQAAFVRAILRGESPAAAMVEAGYGDVSSHYVMRYPKVMEAIHIGVQRSLASEAPVNLAVLRKIRDDDSAPARVRADIGIKLLQMAGHQVPSGHVTKNEVPLAEMSRDQLAAFIERNRAAIDRAEAELAAQAVDVTPAPRADVAKSDANELLDDANAMSFLD